MKFNPKNGKAVGRDKEQEKHRESSLSKSFSKHKALMNRKEYMGNEKTEDEGKMKEGKGGKDNRKTIMKRVDSKPVPAKMC